MIAVTPPGLALRNDPQATPRSRPITAAEPFQGLLGGAAPHPALTPGLETPLPAQVAVQAVDDPSTDPVPATDAAGAFDNVSLAAAHWNRELAFTDLGMFGRYAALAAPASVALAVQANLASAANKTLAGASAPMPSPVTSASSGPVAAKPAMPESPTMPELPTMPVAAAAAAHTAAIAPVASRVAVAPAMPPLPSVLPDVPAYAVADEEDVTGGGVGIAQEASTVIVAETPILSAAVPMEDGAPLPMPEGADGAAPFGPAGKALPRQPAQANPVSAVNLLVTGQGAAVSVAVRSAGDNTEDYARLRRLVEEVAAEFDVGVSDFRLNGSTTTPAFGTLIGGRNGSNAR